MTTMEEAKKLLKRTGKFGWIYPESQHFNEATDLKEEFFHYRVTRVKIWTGTKDNKKVVNGIQFFYKKTGGGEEITLGEHKGEEGLQDAYQIDLERDEYLNNFRIRIDTEVTQIGFDTSKGKKYLYGGESGEEKITHLSEINSVIFAPFGCFNKVLESCGVYYVDRKEYLKATFSGYFELRFMIKKKDGFKDKCASLTLSDVDKALLRTCSLPDAQFNSIIKYILF